MRSRISFKRPDPIDLHAKGFSFVDMHMHTEYSDSRTKVRDLLKKAEKKQLGFSITDHNEIGGCIAAEKIVNKKKTIFIPGIEITTKEACHVLFYFYDIKELKEYFNKYVRDCRYANPNMPITTSTETLVEASKQYNCIVTAAHPCAIPKRYSFVEKIRKKEITPDVVSKLGAVEVINGQNLRGMNQKAIAWCEAINKPMTAGSDSHILASVGSVGTYSVASTREEFLNNILKRKNYVVGKEMSLAMRVLPIATLVNEHLKYFGPTMRFQYEFSIKKPIRETSVALKEHVQRQIGRMSQFAKRSPNQNHGLTHHALREHSQPSLLHRPFIRVKETIRAKFKK